MSAIHRHGVLASLSILLTALSLVQTAAAQERPVPAGTPLPQYAQVRPTDGGAGFALRAGLVDNNLPNIMLTGYWPPTNEMLRRFSPSLTQNPEGWIGENWEGRGYNIYAFFPEFPNGMGKGEGDFEVDYQDTSVDFWYYTAALQPIAVMTYGRAADDTTWQVEMRQRNLPWHMWLDDYLAPVKPTPAPPDSSAPPSYVRYSSLPVDDIAAAVNAANLGITAYVDTLDFCGEFLCEYVAYHGVWYHGLHMDPLDPASVWAAGHIHVGGLVSLAGATEATKISVRQTITSIDWQRYMPGDLNCDLMVDFGDINPFVLRMSNPAAYQAMYPRCLGANADINADGAVNFGDINPFVAMLTNP